MQQSLTVNAIVATHLFVLLFDCKTLSDYSLDYNDNVAIPKLDTPPTSLDHN